MRWSLLALLAFALSAQAKVFKNSYVSFEVPDNWSCIQEGVAWTCTPQNANEAKEAVIVLVAKVAGPEDNLGTFINILKQPKKIPTRVGTPMPSQVMYAQQRTIGGHSWIQAQHLGSEIQDFYTLYIATVKSQLAILISFSSEKGVYAKYNPVFEKSIRSIKIIANQELLFPKTAKPSATDAIGIQVPSAPASPTADIVTPPQRKSGNTLFFILIGAFAALLAAGAYGLAAQRKRKSRSQHPKPKPK